MINNLIRIPPQNIKAEESVLSAILINNELYYDIQDILQPEHFYRTAHAKIYTAMLDLFACKEPVDLVTLATELMKKQQLEEVGGGSYLARLINDIPAAVNIKQYAKYIIDTAMLRNTITISHNIIQKCMEHTEETEDIKDYSQKQMLNNQSQKNITKKYSTKIGDLIEVGIDRWEELQKNQQFITGLATGFKEIDTLTCGLQKSDLIVLAARPSMGKTALALNVAVNIAKDENKVLIFELEMAKQQTVDRIIASEAEINLMRFRSGRFDRDDWHKIISVAEILHDKLIYINDEGALHYSDIIRQARRFYQEYNGLDLIVIDYLTLIRGDKESGRKDLEVGSITKSLKGLAKELNIPIILLSQLNRELERRNNKRPILADLREAGAIEEDADIVIFIYRDDMYNKDPDNPKKGIAEIIFAKHRNGPTGMIQLQWSGTIATFHNLYYGA